MFKAFKLSLKKHEFKMRMNRFVFKPTVNMYTNFKIVIKDFKIVKAMTGVLHIGIKMVAITCEKIKTSGAIEYGASVKCRIKNRIKAAVGITMGIKMNAVPYTKVKSSIRIDTNTTMAAGNKVGVKTNGTARVSLVARGAAWLVQLRKLSEVDVMTLGEIDGLTLGELDRITSATIGSLALKELDGRELDEIDRMKL